jgi:HSP20 family protein
MTLVNLKHKPANGSFNNLMEDFFQGFPSVLKSDFGSDVFKQNPPVNIKENEENYLLEVIVPGFKKEDFKINLEKDILTVSADKKSENEGKTEKHLRNEYKHQSFKHSFTIDDKVNAETIDAKYVNGILTLNLPKKQEVKPTTKQINIL